MKQSIDYALDDHPRDDELPGTSWALAVADDCEGCDDLRIELTLEERGRPGSGLIAHLSASSSRRLRDALARGLREIGEDPGP